ncbi:MAG: ABC transporter ATP-binding protein [Methylobacterium mesophilicum]|nr:ABC transporter ATP-binding protein [Methylobacterium mesophilicum]
MTGQPLLSIRNLEVSLSARRGPGVPVVRGLDLDLRRGGIVGLVGESGSGKSITMMSILGLLPRNARVSGSVRLDGEEILGLSEARLSRIRGARIGMIFQDPMMALNPLITVGDQIAEAMAIHDPRSPRKQRQERAVELLRSVSIPDAARRARQYPHEFSGGMRQRAVIAMAIANDPDLLIADEPTTALDVTIQAQIIDLLRRLCEERDMGLILVTHDLGVVAEIAHDIVTMYAGRIVEQGSVRSTFKAPRHPYTSALFSSRPSVARRVGNLTSIPGAPPSPRELPPGCSFSPRCPASRELCRVEFPPPVPLRHGIVSCFFPVPDAVGNSHE